MKTLITLSLVFFIPILIQAQQNCSKFRNGRFIHPDQKGVLSVRKNGIQKSTSDGKVMAIWKVGCIDDCSYRLMCKKLKAPMPLFETGDLLERKIVGTQDKCFQVDIVFKRNDKVIMPKMTGEMCLE